MGAFDNTLETSEGQDYPGGSKWQFLVLVCLLGDSYTSYEPEEGPHPTTPAPKSHTSSFQNREKSFPLFVSHLVCGISL